MVGIGIAGVTAVGSGDPVQLQARVLMCPDVCAASGTSCLFTALDVPACGIRTVSEHVLKHAAVK